MGRLRNKISDTVGGEGLATGVIVGVSDIFSGAASGARKDGTRGFVTGHFPSCEISTLASLSYG